MGWFRKMCFGCATIRYTHFICVKMFSTNLSFVLRNAAMKVKLYATLRSMVGADAVEIASKPDARMIDILHEMIRRWPQLRSELLDEDGAVSERIHLFVNGRDVRYMDGLEMPIPEDADVRIFPPVGGGT